MATQQLCTALFVLSVLCHTFPCTLCIGLRVTCPNHDCYDDARELRLQAAALRRLLQLLHNKKTEQTTGDQNKSSGGSSDKSSGGPHEGGPSASSLCFCNPLVKMLVCPWNAAHPSQGLSCAD